MDNCVIFSDRKEFRQWLEQHHKREDGVWLVFAKSGALKTVRADDALEEALCFGWIDGQIRTVDATRYLKYFAPRRRGSRWSEKNRRIAASLIERGLMTDSGLSAIARAKSEGAWETSDCGRATEGGVEVLTNALCGFEPALSNYEKMSPSVRRTYAALYLDAKGEATKVRRLQKIVEKLNKNEKPM